MSATTGDIYKVNVDGKVYKMRLDHAPTDEDFNSFASHIRSSAPQPKSTGFDLGALKAQQAPGFLGNVQKGVNLGANPNALPNPNSSEGLQNPDDVAAMNAYTNNGQLPGPATPKLGQAKHMTAPFRGAQHAVGHTVLGVIGAGQQIAGQPKKAMVSSLPKQEQDKIAENLGSWAQIPDDPIQLATQLATVGIAEGLSGSASKLLGKGIRKIADTKATRLGYKGVDDFIANAPEAAKVRAKLAKAGKPVTQLAEGALKTPEEVTALQAEKAKQPIPLGYDLAKGKPKYRVKAGASSIPEDLGSPTAVAPEQPANIPPTGSELPGTPTKSSTSTTSAATSQPKATPDLTPQMANDHWSPLYDQFQHALNEWEAGNSKTRSPQFYDFAKSKGLSDQDAEHAFNYYSQRLNSEVGVDKAARETEAAANAAKNLKFSTDTLKGPLPENELRNIATKFHAEMNTPTVGRITNGVDSKAAGRSLLRQFLSQAMHGGSMPRLGLQIDSIDDLLHPGVENGKELVNQYFALAKDLGLESEDQAPKSLSPLQTQEGQGIVAPSQTTLPHEVQPNTVGQSSTAPIPSSAQTDIPRPDITPNETQPRPTETKPLQQEGAREPVTGPINAAQHAETAHRRAELLFPAYEKNPRKWGEVVDKALAGKLDQEANASQVVKETLSKKRPLSDAEQIGLALRSHDIEKEIDEVEQAAEQAGKEGDDPARQRALQRIDDLQDQHKKLFDALDVGGSELGRGLGIRRLYVPSIPRFGQPGLIRRWTGTVGKEPTETQAGKLKDYASQIKKLQSDLESTQKRVTDLEGQKETGKASRKENVKAAARGERNRVVTRDAYEAAREKLKAARASGGPHNRQRGAVDIPTDQLEAMSQMAAYHIERGVRTTAEIIKNLKADLGDTFTDTELAHAVADAAKKMATKMAPGKGFSEDIKQAGNWAYQEPEVRDLRRRIAKTKRDALQYIADNTKEGVGKKVLNFERANLLSGIPTLGKLATAATSHAVMSPIEEAAGPITRFLSPKVYARGAREPGFNPQAEGKAFASLFSKDTLKSTLEKLKTGHNFLDEAEMARNPYNVPVRKTHAILDIPMRIHGAIKTPIQHLEYARSLEKRAVDAAKRGVNLGDPLIQEGLQSRAYTDSLRAVLLNDNKAATIWNDTINAIGKHSKVAEGVARYTVPIVKVPSNYAGRVGEYAFGSLYAPLRALAARAAKDETPETADAIIRAYKRGGIGLGLMAFGYFHPEAFGGFYTKEKRDEDAAQPNEVKVKGTALPSWLIHSPVISVLQIGATMRHAVDTAHEKGDSSGVGQGLLDIAHGLLEELPFIDVPMQAMKAIETKEGLGKYAGQQATNLVPFSSMARNVAQAQDKDSEGKPIKRKPRGFRESIYQNIPILRKLVPAKDQK